MSTIYLLRHGQSLANVDPSVYADYANTDIPLTETGRDQLKTAGKLLKQDLAFKSIGVFSSPYRRCRESCGVLLATAEIKSAVSSNLLLSEMSYGEQENTNVEDFTQRPAEKWNREQLGPLHYKPVRGENFLDVHTRAGLFVVQQRFFQYIPITIIVSHASLCLMMHYFLTITCPLEYTLEEKAHLYWPNAMIRKYHAIDITAGFEYDGVLGKEHDDIFIS